MNESGVSDTDSGRMKWLSAFFLVVLTYSITGRLGLLAAIPPGHVTAIWPPAGIALAAVYLRGPWMASAVALGSILVNSWAAADSGMLEASRAVPSILCIAAGAALQALAGAAMLRYSLDGRDAFAQDPLRSARGVTLLVAVAFASSFISATVGTVAVFLLQASAWPGFQTTWWTWWLGDTAGTLVFAPVILSFRRRTGPRSRAGIAETFLFAALLFAVGGLGFWGRYPLSYLVAPILVWAAFRFGVRGGTASILSFSVLAIAGAVNGVGPFIGPGFSLNESLLLLQGFMVSSVLTTMVLAAVVEERQRDREFLEHRVEERTVELRGSLAQMRSLQLETEVAKATAEHSGRLAREADKAKSAFLAQMSHELRTPLNAIIGYSELLSESIQESAQKELEPDLEKIHSSAQHLLSLINQILDLSKIEAGKIELIVEEVSIRPLIDGLASTMETLARKNGNRVGIEIDPAVDSIVTDGLRLKQILLNLISNACKFTKGGDITLRLRGAGSQHVLFEVEDTGIGMTPAQMERIFDAFTQADSGTYRSYGGTGIGLAICRQLASAMGGSITARSIHGQGSVFSLSLPRATPG